MTKEELENIKHIFGQILYALGVSCIALKKREIIFTDSTDDPLFNFCNQNTHCSTHMVVVDTLYNFFVLSKHTIYEQLKKSVHLNDKITTLEQKFYEIANISQQDVEHDAPKLFNRLRNALSHGRITLQPRKLVFNDFKIKGNDRIIDRITFEINVQDLHHLIEWTADNIVIPLAKGEFDTQILS